jgi:alcohol dehydrogenase
VRLRPLRACLAGDHQVCPHQTQPGFTHWGSFASYVALHAADVNLVALPDALSFAAAASLGCRYATSFRAVVQQGRVRAGEQVRGHGLRWRRAVRRADRRRRGASVVAVDVSPAALELAESFGAVPVRGGVEAVREATGGGAHLSLDALGSRPRPASTRCCRLRPAGRHVQVGPAARGADAASDGPRHRRWSWSCSAATGMAAHAYPELLDLVAVGRLRPDLLVTRQIGLDDAAQASPGSGRAPGITVVTSF